MIKLNINLKVIGHMKDLKDFEKSYDMNNYEDKLQEIYEKVNYATNIAIMERPMFSMSDFVFYNYDEYLLNTNNDIYAPIKLYACINQPLNKSLISNKYAKTKAPMLHYELNEYRDDLLNTLINLFDETYLLWKDKYSIYISNKKYYEENNLAGLGVSYCITPCIAYENEKGDKGLIYYTDNRKFIDIDYPQIALQNLRKKDEETKGLFTSYIRIFKNLYMKYYNVSDFPFEMFETIFYNVSIDLY